MLSVLSGYGLGEQQMPSPFTFTEGLVASEGAFRCPPGQVPAVSPAGEVIGCKAAPLMTAGRGVPAWVPWAIGGVALAIFVATVWPKA